MLPGRKAVAASEAVVKGSGRLRRIATSRVGRVGLMGGGVYGAYRLGQSSGARAQNVGYPTGIYGQ